MNEILQSILLKRGIPKEQHEAFLNPNYDKTLHDPFLLPDMQKAVERIIKACDNDEQVVIYGDYDVDGMTATALLYDALTSFGLKVDTYTPDRFAEGYGLNVEAVKKIAKSGARLMITVDCGSLSYKEVDEANKLGLGVIVTDHHQVADKLPNAVAVINPHRNDSEYPFKELAGCGVAFKLVQALQEKFLELLQRGVGLAERPRVHPKKNVSETFLERGQEKWLLDLVALGTICDIVPLLDENRTLVYWGLKVLAKTRRPGLKALMAVAKINQNEIDARKIGFVLGPRLNAAGRIDTAKLALELLMTDDNNRALELAQKLDELNYQRRIEQNKVFVQACESPYCICNDDVIVVDGEKWNEGVVGIVASKLVETYRKPSFVLSIDGENVKGSGRSFGDFDLAKAIEKTMKHLKKGGGHSAAAGVNLETKNIETWRKALNEYYKSLKLKNQEKYLLPMEDVLKNDFENLNIELLEELSKLEPFGMGNEQPIFKLEKLRAVYVDRIGSDKNHLKITLSDGDIKMKFIAFGPPEEWFVEPGSKVDIWVNLEINEWNGQVSVEGRIIRLES